MEARKVWGILLLVFLLVSNASAKSLKDQANRILDNMNGEPKKEEPRKTTTDNSSTTKSDKKPETSQQESKGQYTLFQKKMLEEINFARTNPVEYAEDRLKEAYKKGKDNGAYQDLKKQSAKKALQLNPLLCNAAMKYAQYMAEKGVFGHNYNGSPFDRMKKEGYSYSYAGENIACGSYPSQDGNSDPETAARNFVVLWIIDEGVAGVGHRKNILDPNYKEVGVGFFHNKNSAYVNYAVQDFGTQR